MGGKGTITAFEGHAAGTGICFEVEGPSEWLVLSFDYGRPTTTWIHLYLFDPADRLRFSHFDCNQARTAVIHRDPSGCGVMSVPGEIGTGKWRLELSSPPPGTFELQWESGSGSLPSGIGSADLERRFWTDVPGQPGYVLNRYDWDECREDACRWYKGDFHTHTILSDGKMTPEQNMVQADIMGLDFFTATDHNLLSTSWPEGKALVIPGAEITAAGGHWNALGLKRWIDWRQHAPDGGLTTQQGMNRLMREAGAMGTLRSVNHPMLTPWAWTFGETPLDLIDTLEIWNDPTFPGNNAATEQALTLWSALWNEGYRITGIGGSDSHKLATESYEPGGPPSLIGDPATYVEADRLSAAAVLEAVRAGRVYVSRGPVLDIGVTVGGIRYALGSDLTEAVRSSEDGIVVCRIVISGVSEGQLHAIVNGSAASVFEITDTEGTFELIFNWRDCAYVWSRLEIRAADGKLLAFTNPFFCGAKEREIDTWKQLLEKASLGLPSNRT